MTHRFCRAAAAVLVASGLVADARASVIVPPTADATSLRVTLPNGTATTVPAALGQALSGSRFLVPRSYRAAWKPFPAAPTNQDTGGTFNGQTLTAALEIPSDFTAARIWFSNTTQTPYTLSGCLVAASSQWGAPGYSGSTPGITPYDGSGNALTTMTPCTFGNGGALATGDNGGLPATAVPANAFSGALSAATASNATTLTFAAVPANVAVGQVVVAPVGTTNGPYLYASTTVTALTATTVTLSTGARNTIPTGTTIYFLPNGIVVPATTTPPLPAIVATDWMPVTSLARLDGPVSVGNIALGSGIPAGDAVTAVGATSVTLTSPLSAPVPAGTSVRFCQSLTTSAASVPNATLSFASVVNLSVGMVAYLQGSPFVGGGQSSQQPGNPVASINAGANTVTLANPLGPNLANATTSYGSGWSVDFDLPMTITAPIAPGGNIVTVASTAGLVVGMSVRTTGIAATTIASIVDATHYTIAGTASQAIPSGIGVHNILTLATNATAATGTQLTFPTLTGASPMPLAGDTVTGTNIPAGTLIWGITSTSFVMTQSPTGSGVASGQAVQVCKGALTSAAAPAGASTLPFAQTTYPNRLFLVRLRFAGTPTNATYYGPNYSSSAPWNADGLPAFEGDKCASDGIASVAAVGNAAGGCGRLTWFPEYLIEFVSPKRAITVLVTGDSHFAGDTTPMGAINFAHRGLATLSTPNLPVSVVNAAWGGQPSTVFDNLAQPILATIKPDVAVIAGWTWNDAFTASGNAQVIASAFGLARQVQRYGGLPVIVSEYQRQVYGCNSSNSQGEGYRQQVLAYEQAEAVSGIPFLSAAAVMADPVNGASYLNPAYSTDCIHANDNGHAALGAALQGLIRPNLGN